MKEPTRAAADGFLVMVRGGGRRPQFRYSVEGHAWHADERAAGNCSSRQIQTKLIRTNPHTHPSICTGMFQKVPMSEHAEPDERSTPPSIVAVVPKPRRPSPFTAGRAVAAVAAALILFGLFDTLAPASSKAFLHQRFAPDRGGGLIQTLQTATEQQEVEAVRVCVGGGEEEGRGALIVPIVHPKPPQSPFRYQAFPVPTLLTTSNLPLTAYVGKNRRVLADCVVRGPGVEKPTIAGQHTYLLITPPKGRSTDGQPRKLSTEGQQAWEEAELAYATFENDEGVFGAWGMRRNSSGTDSFRIDFRPPRGGDLHGDCGLAGEEGDLAHSSPSGGQGGGASCCRRRRR
jgi:hypothetical protein